MVLSCFTWYWGASQKQQTKTTSQQQKHVQRRELRPSAVPGTNVSPTRPAHPTHSTEPKDLEITGTRTQEPFRGAGCIVQEDPVPVPLTINGQPPTKLDPPVLPHICPPYTLKIPPKSWVEGFALWAIAFLFCLLSTLQIKWLISPLQFLVLSVWLW